LPVLVRMNSRNRVSRRQFIASAVFGAIGFETSTFSAVEDDGLNVQNEGLDIHFDMSEEYKSAWRESYERIPANLKQILKSYRTIIPIRRISPAEMIRKVGVTSTICADPSNNTIYYMFEPRAMQDLRADGYGRMHELSHIVLFEIRKHNPDLAKKWKMLWMEMSDKIHSSDYNLRLESAFVSAFSLKDYNESFAETATYISGEHTFAQPDLSSKDIIRQIEFVKSLR